MTSPTPIITPPPKKPKQVATTAKPSKTKRK